MKKAPAPLQKLSVALQFDSDAPPLPVGALALRGAGRGAQIYFQYDAEFLPRGLALSPLHLPLSSALFHFALPQPAFENLPGVFADSLPDGWGRLLFDRFARSRGMDLGNITALDRLAYMGKSGMGALVYVPQTDAAEGSGGALDLNRIASETKTVMRGASDAVLQDLLALNGSSAGARPKALVGADAARKVLVSGGDDLPEGFEPWLVKFANSQDGADAGAVEYVYALMAQAAGLEMPEPHLFPARGGAGYFGVRRFDSDGKNRLHMHSAAGLLHSDFRAPALDYRDIMGLAQFLSQDIREAEKIYRMAVFNVLAHNRDDHGKNFSFLMNAQGKWRVSPAYDVTFSEGPNGEQSSMVAGAGKNPAEADLLRLAKEFKLPPKQAAKIIEQVKDALARWQNLAAHYGVERETIARISAKLKL